MTNHLKSPNTQAGEVQSTRSQLLKQIREAVEAEQVEDDGSGVWDAGHYDGINDALAAIDKVAKTSQTESTNPSET